MSELVNRAIDAAGLASLATARGLGKSGELDRAKLGQADLLALGALADRVRREEVGDEVRIYSGVQPPGGARPNGVEVVVLPGEEQDLTGLELLREVAIARLTRPRGTGVRVDWTRCGLELAQVALGFGADELCGVLASKRGLPLADGALSGVGKHSRLLPAHTVKRRELAEFVRRAGLRPVFVRLDGSTETADGAFTEAGP